MSDKPRPPSLGPILEFMRELWSVVHATQSLSKRLDARAGVTGPQRLVIRVIGKFPGVSARELADILCIHPSTLSGVVARLQTAGAIRRETHPQDARRALLYLTQRGEALNAIESGTVEAAARRLLRKLPASRISAVTRVLRMLSDEVAAELKDEV